MKRIIRANDKIFHSVTIYGWIGCRRDFGMGSRERCFLQAWQRMALLLAMCFPLAACYGRDENMALELVGYNHMDRDIGWFHVDDAGGPYLGKHRGSGNFTCCISIPGKYKPGMTVRVGWRGEEIGAPQERVVEVPPYGPGDGGMFAVHSLRNGQVKVYVTMIGPRHAGYPLKGDESRM